ncbi:HEAT repeat domain-containing protein [Mesorhizobium sp. B292B1B]|uniref:HEAT repeat domain-containing protein n=1 Tax=unclassified Mesorhizobium TaxID=325217 RepID=UPI001CD05F12|nr:MULTISPECIES: HEAT repeat domain-containing protein [unclassified Mesorhizobium]MCA0012059.1 HEAT repeat domain-containing protein [Mesorhizobium sp. B294B1A1]MCA0038313.1 HEAT repeat domain-containing protein [Mesorhizobium sp. B292B1B]
MLAATGKPKPEGAPEQRRIVPDVVRQHAEQAAFFWSQRDTLMEDDPPDLDVVAGVDRRLEANLDGLRIAGPAAWPFVTAAYEDFPEKGELFLYGWMAIEQNDSRRVADAVEFGRQSQDDARGLVGALAWHRPGTIALLVRDWIGAPDAFKRFLGVSACLGHGVDPKQMLARLVRDPDARVRATSLRLAGKLKRADLAHELRNALSDQEENARFWAAWSLAKFGSGDLAGKELRKVAVLGGPHALAALRAVVKAGPEQDVRAWMGGLLKNPETAAIAVRGSGMLGDRTILHWLIHQMRKPALSVAAGAALLDLLPEAREADLFTTDPSHVGPAFAEHFGDDVARVPFADKVKAWGAKLRSV